MKQVVTDLGLRATKPELRFVARVHIYRYGKASAGLVAEQLEEGSRILAPITTSDPEHPLSGKLYHHCPAEHLLDGKFVHRDRLYIDLIHRPELTFKPTPIDQLHRRPSRPIELHQMHVRRQLATLHHNPRQLDYYASVWLTLAQTLKLRATSGAKRSQSVRDELDGSLKDRQIANSARNATVDRPAPSPTTAAHSLLI